VSEEGELIILSGNGEQRAIHAGEVRVFRGIRTF
jgi:hypothetical protein